MQSIGKYDESKDNISDWFKFCENNSYGAKYPFPCLASVIMYKYPFKIYYFSVKKRMLQLNRIFFHIEKLFVINNFKWLIIKVFFIFCFSKMLFFIFSWYFCPLVLVHPCSPPERPGIICIGGLRSSTSHHSVSIGGPHHPFQFGCIIAISEFLPSSVFVRYLCS